MPDYISILLIVLLGVREYFSYKERKDLYDRLMSKDLPEFKALTEAPQDPTPEPETLVPIDSEEARDELLGETHED